MGVLKDLEQWRQPNGLYSNQFLPKDDSTGNGIAVTALALWLAHRRQEFRSTEGMAVLESCVSSLNACVPKGQYGVLNRSPTKLDDQNGWDDYICLAAASSKAALNLPFSRLIWEHGKAHWGSYNNVRPEQWTPQSFFWRSPSFIAHCVFALGQVPSLFLRIFWCISILFSGLSNSEDSSARVLALMKIEAMAGLSGIATIASAVWSFRVRRDTMSLKMHVARWLATAQYDDGKPIPNWDHPIVKFWPEEV